MGPNGNILQLATRRCKAAAAKILLLNVTKMTMFAKAVDVFHNFFKAASSKLAFYTALEIRTEKLRAKVAPNSEKLGATLKSWGPN